MLYLKSKWGFKILAQNRQKSICTCMYNLFPTLNLGNIIQQKDIIMLQIS